MWAPAEAVTTFQQTTFGLRDQGRPQESTIADRIPAFGQMSPAAADTDACARTLDFHLLGSLGNTGLNQYGELDLWHSLDGDVAFRFPLAGADGGLTDILRARSRRSALVRVS